MQMKKNTFITLFGISLLFTYSLLSCTKDNHVQKKQQEGYDLITAVHNSLNEPVNLVQGIKVIINSEKDTTAFTRDTIKIKPDSTYSYSTFICTKNCNVAYNTSIMQQTYPLMKFIIGNKEKIDTSCGFLISRNPDVFYDCDSHKNIKSYYNESSWKETKDDNTGNVKKEYTIDQSDVDEAK